MKFPLLLLLSRSWRTREHIYRKEILRIGEMSTSEGIDNTCSLIAIVALHTTKLWTKSFDHPLLLICYDTIHIVMTLIHISQLSQRLRACVAIATHIAISMSTYLHKYVIKYVFLHAISTVRCRKT